LDLEEKAYPSMPAPISAIIIDKKLMKVVKR